jgi:hypothetical protein
MVRLQHRKRRLRHTREQRTSEGVGAPKLGERRPDLRTLVHDRTLGSHARQHLGPRLHKERHRSPLGHRGRLALVARIKRVWDGDADLAACLVEGALVEQPLEHRCVGCVQAVVARKQVGVNGLDPGVVIARRIEDAPRPPRAHVEEPVEQALVLRGRRTVHATDDVARVRRGGHDGFPGNPHMDAGFAETPRRGECPAVIRHRQQRVRW